MIQNFKNFKSNGLLEGKYDSNLGQITTDIISLMLTVSTNLSIANEKGLIKTGIVSIDVEASKNNWLFYFDEATESQSELDKFFTKNCKPFYIGTGKDSKADDTFFLKFKY